MAAFNKFNCFVEDVAEQKHNLATDDLRVMLTNTAPDGAADAVFGDLTEIAPGNGYTAGGLQTVQSSSAQTGGLYRLVGSSPQFTAAGGNIGPYRYAVLYNYTHASKPLIGYWDYGVSITLTNGNTFTVSLDQVNGILTLQ